MLFRHLKTNQIRSFKNRSKNGYNYFFSNFFLLNLVNKKQIIFEFTYFKIIKLVFKKSLKYKYSLFKVFFFFFNLLPNYPISIKNKNSRMGKGVGKFLRWTFLLKSNSLICSFTAKNAIRFSFLLFFLKKRIHKNLILVTNNDNY